MKLQDQVCTLEQAKRLKKLGVESESSLFCYRHYSSSTKRYCGTRLLLRSQLDIDWEYGFSFTGKIEPIIETVRNTYACGPYPFGSGDTPLAAFSVVELARVLKSNMPYWIEIWDEWGRKDSKGQPRGYGTLATACAAVLIDLLETGQVTPEEVNTRLANVST